MSTSQSSGPKVPGKSYEGQIRCAGAESSYSRWHIIVGVTLVKLSLTSILPHPVISLTFFIVLSYSDLIKLMNHNKITWY